MRCSQCGAQIEGNNGTCPLCGAPMQAQAPCYPPRKAKVRRTIVPFTDIYLSVTVLATIALGIINAFYRPETHYWAIGLMAAWYLYITLRRTILGMENTHYKIMGQTVTLLVLLGTTGLVLHAPVVFEWVIPLVYGVAWIIGGIVACIAPTRTNRHLLSLWFQSLLGGVDVIICLSLGYYWVPAVVAGGLALALCVVLTAIRPRELWNQIKRTFDR